MTHLDHRVRYDLHLFTPWSAPPLTATKTDLHSWSQGYLAKWKEHPLYIFIYVSISVIYFITERERISLPFLSSNVFLIQCGIYIKFQYWHGLWSLHPSTIFELLNLREFVVDILKYCLTTTLVLYQSIHRGSHVRMVQRANTTAAI